MPDSEANRLIDLSRAISPAGPTESAAGLAWIGYGAGPTGEPVDAFRPVGKDHRRSHGRREGTSPPPRPETRAAARAQWRFAKEAAEAMLCAAQSQDGMGLVVAADNLDLALGKLWELRATRDIDWQTILNHTQGMLKQLFAAKKVEQLAPEQCRCILEIVDRYLGPATKAVDDLNEVIRLIEDAGFDPYAAISGDPISSPEEENEPGA